MNWHFLFFFLENKPKIKQEHKHKSSKNSNTNTNADKSNKNTNTNPARIQTQTHQSIFSKTNNNPIRLPPSTQTPSTNKLKWKKKPNNKSQIPNTHGQIKQNTLFDLTISPWLKTPSSTSHDHKLPRHDWWGRWWDGVAEESFCGWDGVVWWVAEEVDYVVLVLGLVVWNGAAGFEEAETAPLDLHQTQICSW